MGAGVGEGKRWSEGRRERAVAGEGAGCIPTGGMEMEDEMVERRREVSLEKGERDGVPEPMGKRESGESTGRKSETRDWSIINHKLFLPNTRRKLFFLKFPEI